MRDNPHPEPAVSRRLIIHIVVAVLFWVLFGYYWGLVAQRRITANTIDAIQILALLVVTVWALTTLWIQHNRRRFAGRPDRRTRRTASGEHENLLGQDSIGYAVQIEAGEGGLHAAPYVEIEIDETNHVKIFRSGPVPDAGGAS